MRIIMKVPKNMHFETQLRSHHFLKIAKCK